MLIVTHISILDLLLSILMWIIIVQAVLSWLMIFNVVNTHNDFVRQLLYALGRMTEPLYRPIRRILPDFGSIDFSPVVVLVLIQILRSIVFPAILISAAS